MRKFDEPSNFVEPTTPPQQMHKLCQRPVVAGVLLEQLREVVNRGFVVFLLEHKLGKHQRSLFVVRVVPENFGARLLTRINFPRVEPHPAERQQRGHVGSIVLERLFVEPESGLDVVARLVQPRNLHAELRHETNLFFVLFPVSSGPQHERLSHRVRTRQGLYPTLAVLDPLADLREHSRALHSSLQGRGVHRVFEPVHQLGEPILSLAKFLQANIQRG